MNSINFNGKEIKVPNGTAVTINHDGVYVNGKLLKDTEITSSVLEVKGEIGSLTINTDVSVTCEDVKGDVFSSGSVNCNDVGGNINSQGHVNCNDVEGNVYATGSVNANNIEGEIHQYRGGL